MNKVFGVIDANSAYWTTEGEADYERATFVMAGSPAEACAKARENGFDGLLVASQQQSADESFQSACAAARKAGGACFATDEGGEHAFVSRHAPAEYAEYQRVLRAAQAAMRGTKYEGSIA